MNKAYDLITWRNNTAPALNDTNLNKESAALNVIDDRVIELFNKTQNLEGYQIAAQQAVDDARAIATQMQSDVQDAIANVDQAVSGYVNQSKSWAIGEGYPQRTDQATNNSKYFASMAEQSAIANGYVHFLIDNNGHLIYIKSKNVNDLDFEIVGNTNLHVVIDDGE